MTSKSLFVFVCLFVYVVVVCAFLFVFVLLLFSLTRSLKRLLSFLILLQPKMDDATKT